ncbi:3'-5' exonuclease [Govanella unica]|uniref:3'-5' exonuclease n=1 Tax=Govanella unica TaxID=2975056 RepID=A0A9X3Z7R3_9PROT|nr:3'-5' exonuclease [Govania unica]MDA5194505.1 3'-5' exonuclease [Govania unica]
MTTFTAIDFETANNARDSACAIGLVRVEQGKIVAEAVHLIRPPSLEFRFTWVHGITRDDVADAPDFATLWPEIAPFFEGVDFISAHNARFDRGVLEGCCDTYGLTPPPLPYLCTVDLARKMWNLRPTKLPDVCRYLAIPLDHHRADSDSRACAAIVIAALEDGWQHAAA